LPSQTSTPKAAAGPVCAHIAPILKVSAEACVMPPMDRSNKQAITIVNLNPKKLIFFIIDSSMYKMLVKFEKVRFQINSKVSTPKGVFIPALNPALLVFSLRGVGPTGRRQDHISKKNPQDIAATQYLGFTPMNP
jgi:hypothetical protein